MLMYILIFIVSLTTLLLASDRFVDSAEKIGLSLGISPFIIGVTIVAFGTSIPELATSIASVYSGTSEIVVGNVIGSNITNILLVLGATAIVGGCIDLDFDVMDTDMPLLFASAFFLMFVLRDFHVSGTECILFLIALAVFLINSFSGKSEDGDRPKVKALTYLILVLAGVLVFIGAKYTIFAVEKISLEIGISPEIIALSVVALGTSLPEVIVSVIAAKKGKNGIAVGNVLGSNIFNTYAVMSIPGLMTNLKIPADVLQFSGPFMIVVMILFGMMCLSKRISRWEGVTLVLLYIFFISQLYERGINLQ